MEPLTGSRRLWTVWLRVRVLGKIYALAMFALSLLFIYGPQSIQPVSGLSFLSLLALTCLAVGSMIGLEILSHILGANWSQVEADVLEVKEQGFEFGTSIIIRYRYQWQGHLYEGIRSLSRNRFLQEVEMLLARYSAGSRAESGFAPRCLGSRFWSRGFVIVLVLPR